MEYILKYNNRKLYSKHLKKYVNLDYIIDLAKNDVNKFMIVKHEKGLEVSDMSEITNEVLAEAVVKLSPSKEKLVQLIKES